MARPNPDTNAPPARTKDGPPPPPPPPDPRELEFHWEIVPAYAGDPSATLAMAQGWEPFSVVYEPESGRPVIWFRRRVVG